ncbi:MAG: DUF1844 domain-containing protein [Myxococcales bacterium]|nr:DUF1844 domain-containing protein [Myxococcales bacterium]MCC6523444.1 DUF1844 domain-containing protein [Polyangiaceae bacterium]
MPVEAEALDGSPALPQLDFTTFVLSIVGSAYVHLGDAPEREGRAAEPNLLLARQDIELLRLLQDKTKGNLSGDEERLISQALYDLRMRYVEVSKAT